MAQQRTVALARTQRQLNKVVENHDPSPDQLRALAIYQDYSEGTTNGAGKFAKAIGFSRQGAYNIINCEVPITKRFIDACAKLGYSPEWIMFGTGDMMINKKDKVLMTDVVQIKAHVGTLVAQLKAKDLRMAGLEQELESVKKDLKDIRKMLNENGIHYRSH